MPLDGFLDRWIWSSYAANTPFHECLTSATWIMLDSSPQPDAALTIRPARGGLAKETVEGLMSGRPHLVVEVRDTAVAKQDL